MISHWVVASDFIFSILYALSLNLQQTCSLAGEISFKHSLAFFHSLICLIPDFLYSPTDYLGHWADFSALFTDFSGVVIKIMNL